MAADMTWNRGVVLMLLLSLPGLNAWGESLSDPTRPPAGIGEGAGGEGGVTAGGVPHMVPSVKGLTSVIISPVRCAAIIDGKTVNLGAMHDGARLVEITPGAVVLESGKGRRTLELFHGVGVKLTATEAPARKAAVCKLDTNEADRKPAMNHKTDKKTLDRIGQKEKK